MFTPASPTAQYLFDAIEASTKTQKEIAREVGYPSANIITMMKKGETKVPVSRIPALAKALDIDTSELIDIALKEYHPELRTCLREFYGVGLNLQQKLMLELLDEAETITPVELDAGLCDTLLQVMVFAGRLQMEIG